MPGRAREAVANHLMYIVSVCVKDAEKNDAVGPVRCAEFLKEWKT